MRAVSLPPSQVGDRQQMRSHGAHPPPTRSPPSATPNLTPRADTLRERSLRLTMRPDRQHAEDGHRHQCPETPGCAASPRRPLGTSGSRAARWPHPASGQREGRIGDLPLRHGRFLTPTCGSHLKPTPGSSANSSPATTRPSRRRHRRPGTLYAEVKAIASGEALRAFDPAIQTDATSRAEADLPSESTAINSSSKLSHSSNASSGSGNARTRNQACPEHGSRIRG